jgi:hypothetical protein
MTYTDAFLAEKLREILLRLYPRSFTNQVSSDLAPRNELKLSPGESLSGPTTEFSGKNGGPLHGESSLESEGMNPVQLPLSNQTNDIGIVHNFTSVEGDSDDAAYIVGNFSLSPAETPLSPVLLHAPNNESHFPQYIHPVPAEDDSSSYAQQREHHPFDTNALTRNIQEFIQVLKMSLNGGGGDEGNGVVDPLFGGDTNNNMLLVNRGETDNTLTGVSVTDSAGMEFNLTMDDINDLNNLLSDDSGSSLPFKHFIIIFSYVLIGCVSIIGNLLVVQVCVYSLVKNAHSAGLEYSKIVFSLIKLVIRSRRLHTLTHSLLANLAVADLCMATLNIPFSAARVILSEWPFGSVLCHAVPFVQVTSVYVTSITMAVIAIDRYAVINNMTRKTTISLLSEVGANRNYD